MNFGRGCIPISKGGDDSLKGVDPSVNHRTGSAPIYQGSDGSFKGLDP